MKWIDRWAAAMRRRKPVEDDAPPPSVPALPQEPTYRGYLGATTDVSDQWASEAQLRQAESLLRVAAHAGRLGAWSVERKGLKVTWSDEMRAIHEMPEGYAPTLAEAIGFFEPDSADRITAAIGACLDDGTPFDLELQIITARKRLAWVRTIGEAERDSGGAIMSVQGAFQDVSILKRAAESARLNAARLSRVLESLPDGFIIVGHDWDFIYVNGAAEGILQRTRADLLGRSLWTQFPTGGCATFFTQFQRAADESITVDFEELCAPLGVWLTVKAYPSEQGLTITLRDDSERIIAQREILQLNAQLEERVASRTAELEASTREFEAFSYSVAHDLRQPLSALAGFSQLVLKHEQQVSEKGRHWLGRIKIAAHQMDEMTIALLRLARMSRTPMEMKPVDLARIASAVATNLLEHDPGRVVDVIINPLPTAEGDPALLTQVMANLMGNAWKFTAKQPRARIEVGAVVSPAGEDVFYVKDSGVGFDMEYSKSLFRAFHRLHSPREFEGTGIGLATVHKIVTTHGGRIWAHSEVGAGATFFFTLKKAK